MGPFSRFNEDWRNTLFGLAAGAIVLAVFLALGIGFFGAILMPVVAIGLTVLLGEASERKTIREAETNLDARYRATEQFLANRQNEEEQRKLRVEEMRRLRAEEQRIALVYEPQLGAEIANETYLESWQRFNKRLARVVHTLSPFNAQSTPWSNVQSELEDVLAKLKAGAALIQQLEEHGIQTSEKGQQLKRLTDVVIRLGKQKAILVERSLVSRFRDWDEQLLDATQMGKPWLALGTETEVSAWLKFRTRPEKQPFGVSHEGAEYLVADWLRYLGQSGVEVTQFVGDGGVDVHTEELIVQVKNYGEGGVSSSELRDLFGTATAAGRGAALFTSSRLTRDAKGFAESNEIACIAYNAKLSQLFPLTKAGQRLLEQGHYEEDG